MSILYFSSIKVKTYTSAAAPKKVIKHTSHQIYLHPEYVKYLEFAKKYPRLVDFI